LSDALHGRLTDHHRFMLELYLGQHDCLSEAIARIDRQVHGLITRRDEQVEAGQATLGARIILLGSIPGVSILSATLILSEIGRDPGLRRGRL
jgi:transposase